MAFDNRDSIDFANAKIPQLFANIFFPTLLGMVFSIAFILTDGIFIGNGVGSDALACINLVAPIMMFSSATGMMLAVGSSVVAAIHISKGNEKAARINITQAIWTALIFFVVICILMYAFPRPVLRLLGTTERLMPMALDYYLWFIPTCLFSMIQVIGSFTVRLDGNPKFAMFMNIVPSVINCILDYTFIFPLKWGLMGAALATDIGGFTAVLMFVYYMVRKSKVLKWYYLKATVTSVRLAIRNVGYMVKVGFSGFINEFSIAAMMISGNYMFVRMLGEDGVAAFSVSCYLFPVIFMIDNAVAQSAQPIISYNYGKNNTARVKKTFRFSIFTAIMCGVAVIALLNIFCNPIISAFLHRGTNAFNIASEGFPYFTSGFIFFAVNIAVIGYYQSIEKAAKATLFTIMRGIVFPVAFFMILPYLAGFHGLWLAVPASELATTLLILLVSFGDRRIMHKKTEA